MAADRDTTQLFALSSNMKERRCIGSLIGSGKSSIKRTVIGQCNAV